MDVRKFVGPQTDFKKFLLKYPEVFEVQGEYVALRERVTNGADGAGGEGLCVCVGGLWFKGNTWRYENA